MRLREDREEVGAAQEYQRRDLIEEVDDRDGDGDRNQDHHEPGLPPVDVLEQVIQAQDQEKEDDVRGETAHDSDAVGQLGSGDLVGSSRCIPGDDESVGNVDVVDGSDHGKQQVQHSCSPRRRFG